MATQGRTTPTTPPEQTGMGKAARAVEKGFGKHYNNSNRFNGSRPRGLEQAVTRSFQSALTSTLESAISEGFAMFTSKLSGNDLQQQQQQQQPQQHSPPARAGSALTRAIVGLFGGTSTSSEPPAEQKPHITQPSGICRRHSGSTQGCLDHAANDGLCEVFAGASV